MCPLRLVLIFLSATLAGFFVLRSLRTNPDEEFTSRNDDDDSEIASCPNKITDLSCSTKVRAAIRSAFWTCADMASGRYLWRNLVSSSSSSPPSSSPAAVAAAAAAPKKQQ